MDPAKLCPTADLPCKVAIRAAMRAGERVRELFGASFSSQRKQVAGRAEGWVTQADMESEQRVVETIRTEFPSDLILSEESYSQVSPRPEERIWVIDPLDGTNNFAFGIPHFAISIAVYLGESPLAAVIHDPLSEDWFVAVRGGGAWWNGERAQVNSQATIPETIAAFGFYYDRGRMMEATLAALGDLFRSQIVGVRRFGAAALDLAYVGIGRFGAFFEFQLAPWDFAAGRLFVEEAGGQVSTCQQNELKLAKSSVLATNGILHSAFAARLQPHWPADGTPT